MRSLIVILLLTYLVMCHGEECQAHEHAIEGCASEPYICKIDCINQEGAKCTGNGTCTEALGTNDDNLPTFTDMSAEKCSELCSASDAVAEIEQRCRFWRWEYAAGRTCTLMSDAQCTVYEGCSGDHCSCGDNGCQGGATPAPPPSKKACTGPIVYEQDHIHWTCRKSDGGHLSPYKEESLEDGAICTTIQKCADWAEEGVGRPMTLQVKCNDGKWEAADTGDEEVYTSVLPGDGVQAILEPGCTGGNNKLQLPIANIVQQPGSDLVCQSTPVKEGDFYIIAAPNSCILLCDNQLGWTLESAFDPVLGVSRFKCETCTNGEFPRIADEEGTEAYTQDGTVVECWPVRKH